MNVNTKSLLRQLMTRLSLVLAAAVFCLNAVAENEVTIDEFSIKLDETKTVAIYLNNSDPMSSLQVDITLPAGLVYVENSLTRNEDRLIRGMHSVYMNPLSNNTNTYRFTILASDMYNIAGDSGPVAYFQVTNKNLTDSHFIELTNIFGSSFEVGEDNQVTNIRRDIAPYSARVVPHVGRFYLPDSLEIKTDGTAKKVDVGLVNYVVSVRGMEGTITLPEGLSFEKNDAGALRFDYSDRLQQNAAITGNVLADGRTMRFVVSDLSAETIKGDSGVVFSFYVKASETLAATSEIVLSDGVVADNQARDFDIIEEANAKVINSYIAYYTPANDSVQGLRDRYAAAVERVEAEAPAVKDSAVVVEGKTAIETRIGTLATQVETAYNEETLAANYDAILAPVVSIDSAIVAWVDMALAYQQSLSVNDSVYSKLQGDIAALQAQLDSAQVKLNNECPDVAAWFTDSIADIQANIDSVNNEVKRLYDAMELTEETTIETTQIVAAIETLVTDAVAAQTTATLNAYYAEANDTIAGLRARYDAAVQEIAEKAAAVKDSALVTDAMAAIVADMDSLQASVDKAYEEAVLVEQYEQLLAPVAGIDTAIVTMVNDAVAYGQKVVANNEAYTRLTAEIATVQTQLDAAETQITEQCAAVAAQYTATIAALQQDVDSITAEVKALYVSIELTAESTVDVATIQTAITEMVEAAVAGQAAVVANNEAYTRLTAEIATVQAQLDAAETRIAQECPNVAAQFTDSIAAIQANIDTLSSEVKALYEAIELTAESTIDVTGIETAITEMVETAVAGQAAVVANNEAYVRLTAEIAAVQAKLDVAADRIAAECPNVGALFTDSIAAIQADIDTISSEVEAQYKAIELTAESTINVAVIETAITNVVNAALQAEQTMSANEAAYLRLTAEIEDLQAQLDSAVTKITVECADVAAQYTATLEGIQADIDTIQAEVNAKYEATELTAESTIDGAAIEAAINEVVEAAVAGQQAVTVNEEAYARLTADIAALQAQLDEAETQITDECADVAEQYTATLEGIQADIDSITNEVKAQYEAVELTAESTIDGAAIEAAINEVVEAAVAAQEAYEANEEAYARLTAGIEDLQAQLDAAKAKIAEDCADVADQFTETIEGIQADIDSITAEVEAQYEAVELTEESEIDGAAISAAIEKVVEDAIAAQGEFSGIDGILMDVENGEAKVYSISGQLLDAPVKGQVNIFKYANGKVVKFYMK